MEEKVLVDATAIYGLLCADSPDHRAARVILRQMQKAQLSPLLTNYIVAEAHGLLVTCLGPDAGRTWFRYNVWPVEYVQEADEKKAREIILRPGADYTYIDAASFAVMERLGLEKVFTFNRSFADYGFKVLDVE